MGGFFLRKMWARYDLLLVALLCCLSDVASSYISVTNVIGIKESATRF